MRKSAKIVVLAITLVALSCIQQVSQLDLDLCDAAKKGDTNAINRYLDSAGAIDKLLYEKPHHRGRTTLLQVAIRNGRADTVEFLLSRGADPNKLDSSGKSPLIWTLAKSEVPVSDSVRLNVLKSLLKSGAMPDAPSATNYWWTPLMVAAKNGQHQMVDILLSNGARVSATNVWGATALHVTKDAETARKLISAGADIRALTDKRETPMEMATKDKRFDVVTVLSNALAPASP